ARGAARDDSGIGDSAVNARGGLDAAIQYDGEHLADILFRHPAKSLGSVGIQVEADRWPAVLIARRIGTLQVASGDRSDALDRIKLSFAVCNPALNRREYLEICRNETAVVLCGCGGTGVGTAVHQLQFQKSGGLRDALQTSVLCC